MKTGLTLLLFAECPNSYEVFLSIFLQWIVREQPWGQEENRIPPPSQADDRPAYGTWLVHVPSPSHDYFSFPGKKELGSPSSVNRPLRVRFMNRIPHKGGGSWALICHLLGECTQLLGGGAVTTRIPYFVWGMAWTSNWESWREGSYLGAVPLP